MPVREEVPAFCPEMQLAEPEMEHRIVVNIPASQYIRFEQIRFDLWKLMPQGRRIPSNSQVFDYLITLYHTTPEEVEEECAKIGKRVATQPVQVEIQGRGIQGNSKT